MMKKSTSSERSKILLKKIHLDSSLPTQLHNLGEAPHHQSSWELCQETKKPDQAGQTKKVDPKAKDGRHGYQEAFQTEETGQQGSEPGDFGSPGAFRGSWSGQVLKQS